MHDADEEIHEIKREIVESRGLVIKTNNLTNSLAADIKAIAKRQAGYERRSFWNSAVAYVVFAALIFIGLKLALDARISEIESEREGLERQVEELRRALADETTRGEERERAEARAKRFYDLIREQQRSEVVERYEALTAEKLSPAEAAFFRETYDKFRLDLSLEAYQVGLDLMRTERYAEAAEKFQESVQRKPDASHIPAVNYQLARALRRLGRRGEAMLYARQVAEQEIDPTVRDDGLWLASLCAEELGDLDQARADLRKFLTEWPRSALRLEARDRIREMNGRVAAARSNERERQRLIREQGRLERQIQRQANRIGVTVPMSSDSPTMM